jgi:hypothetical protein
MRVAAVCAGHRAVCFGLLRSEFGVKAGFFKEAPGAAPCNVCTEHSLSVVGSALATMCR